VCPGVGPHRGFAVPISDGNVVNLIVGLNGIDLVSSGNLYPLAPSILRRTIIAARGGGSDAPFSCRMVRAGRRKGLGIEVPGIYNKTGCESCRTELGTIPRETSAGFVDYAGKCL